MCSCLPAFTQPAKGKFLVLFEAQKREKKEVGTILSKNSNNRSSIESFTLFLLQIQIPEFGLLLLVCTRFGLSSSFIQASAQLSKAVSGGESRFYFPRLRLIHSFHCGKSSKMHVQHELPFILSYLQSEVLPPELTCCSAPSAAEGFSTKPNQLCDAAAGLNVIKRQHQSRLNEQVNEGNE